MKVIKEGYVLYNISYDNYVCMQNTQTPKVYASKNKAEEAAQYRHNTAVDFKVQKVFLIVGEDDDGN